jgi:LSD1 subclass zinc finger protein
MAIRQLFHCPNCNAALDYSGNGASIVRCDYCHSVIIVPESLRTTDQDPPEKKAEPKPPPKPAKPKLSEKEAVAKVTELARSEQKIEAMKVYREAFPVGLQEAKEAIEQTASGLPLPIPEVRWEDEEDLPLAAAKEITHLAALGKTEEAGRLYRVTFGTSHVEAKTAVEQLLEGKSIDIARHRARRESQATAVRREREEAEVPNPARGLRAGIFLLIIFIIGILIGLALIVAAL